MFINTSNHLHWNSFHLNQIRINTIFIFHIYTHHNKSGCLFSLKPHLKDYRRSRIWTRLYNLSNIILNTSILGESLHTPSSAVVGAYVGRSEITLYLENPYWTMSTYLNIWRMDNPGNIYLLKLYLFNNKKMYHEEQIDPIVDLILLKPGNNLIRLKSF